MRLSVVIPCYNEKNTIGQLLQRVRAAPWPDKEIIVVDDCSRDGTRDLLQGELRGQIDQLVMHEVNQGKGAALRSGIKAATGADYIYLSEVQPRDSLWHDGWPLYPAYLERGMAHIEWARPGAKGDIRAMLLKVDKNKVPNPERSP